MRPCVLSIAGTDPIGGAGLPADLKTCTALGAYGLSVVTAVVAQNSVGVTHIAAVSPAIVAAQLHAVFDEVEVDAIKIGMLPDAGVMETIARVLARRHSGPVVLDPVMRASSGDALMSPYALQTLRETLLPLATVLTPNLAEAATLLAWPVPGDTVKMRLCAEALRELGPAWVLLKGGHLEGGRSPDLLVGAEGMALFDAPRLAVQDARGTGCTLASAIAALLPRMPMHAAVATAKQYLLGMLRTDRRVPIGRGGGALDHFAHWPAPPSAR